MWQMNGCYLEVHHRAEDVCALNGNAGQSTAALVNIQHTDEKQKMTTPNWRRPWPDCPAVSHGALSLECQVHKSKHIGSSQTGDGKSERQHFRTQ